MSFDLLEKYNQLNETAKSAVDKQCDEILEMLFGEDCFIDYTKPEHFNNLTSNPHMFSSILGISYNYIAQSTQAPYNEKAQHLACGPHEFSAAVYMKVIHEVQEKGYKTIAIGNFGSIILDRNYGVIATQENAHPYDYQPNQNNFVYGFTSNDADNKEVIIGFVDYRIAKHIVDNVNKQGGDLSLIAVDLNRLDYEYFARYSDTDGKVYSPITTMAIGNTTIGYIINKEYLASEDNYGKHIHKFNDYNKEDIVEEMTAYNSYKPFYNGDFFVYDFKVNNFKDRAKNPEVVEGFVNEIREQIVEEGIKPCHVEPVIMAVDEDSTTYFRMLVWATTPNSHRFLPPAVVEDFIHKNLDVLTPVFDVAKDVDIKQYMDVVTLSDDLKEHIDSIKEFLTPGSFAVELNHYLQLARDNFNLRTIDYINLNGVSFIYNSSIPFYSRPVGINGKIVVGKVIDVNGDDVQPVSKLDTDVITIIRNCKVRNYSTNIMDTDHSVEICFKGKKTYQEVVDKLEEYQHIKDRLLINKPTVSHSAFHDGLPLFVLSYCKTNSFISRALVSKVDNDENEMFFLFNHNYKPGEFNHPARLVGYKCKKRS
jgi:hypothetical protein